jgi:two-component system NtrC family sensor kinase
MDSTDAFQALFGHPGEAQSFADRIVDAIAALIVVLDREGRILRFNAACQALTGWGAFEVIGQPIFERFIPPEQHAAVRAVFAHLCQGNFPIQHEHDWLRRDGTRVTIAWRSTCAVDAGGRVLCVIGTGSDITRQRRAEHTLAALVEHSPNVAIQIYDRDGTIRMWNPASERLYGWSAEEAVGHPASETVLRGQGLADLWAAFSGIERDGQPLSPAVFQVWHRDGHEILALSTIFAINGAEGRRQFVRMDLDVTEQVRLQEALSAANEQLERRVLARTAELAATNSELESFS